MEEAGGIFKPQGCSSVGGLSKGLSTSCPTSNTLTLVQSFYSAVEQKGGYVRCKAFFSQNLFGLRPGQWMIAMHSNFNFFYINIMRRCLSWSWKPWGWDIGKNKQRDPLRALWAVNGSPWHALTGHFILTLLNQLDGESSKLIAKVLWQFLFTTVVINRCCYPLLGIKYSLGQVCVGCADCSKIRERLRVRGVCREREHSCLSRATQFQLKAYVRQWSMWHENASASMLNAILHVFRGVYLIFIPWNTVSVCNIYKLTISLLWGCYSRMTQEYH